MLNLFSVVARLTQSIASRPLPSRTTSTRSTSATRRAPTTAASLTMSRSKTLPSCCRPKPSFLTLNQVLPAHLITRLALSPHIAGLLSQVHFLPIQQHSIKTNTCCLSSTYCNFSSRIFDFFLFRKEHLFYFNFKRTITLPQTFEILKKVQTLFCSI